MLLTGLLLTATAALTGPGAAATVTKAGLAGLTGTSSGPRTAGSSAGIATPRPTLRPECSGPGLDLSSTRRVPGTRATTATPAAFSAASNLAPVPGLSVGLRVLLAAATAGDEHGGLARTAPPAELAVRAPGEQEQRITHASPTLEPAQLQRIADDVAVELAELAGVPDVPEVEALLLPRITVETRARLEVERAFPEPRRGRDAEVAKGLGMLPAGADLGVLYRQLLADDCGGVRDSVTGECLVADDVSPNLARLLLAHQFAQLFVAEQEAELAGDELSTDERQARLGPTGVAPRPADVARAVSEPPRTTEELLHPARYWEPESREAPTPVAFDDAVLPAGWERAHEDTLGELVLAIFTTHPELRRGLSASPLGIAETRFTNSAADGWDGDRVVLARRDGAQYVRLATRWQDAEEAEEFASAAHRVAEALILDFAIELEGPFVVVTAVSGPIAPAERAALDRAFTPRFG
jgi:hypothetical protein